MLLINMYVINYYLFLNYLILRLQSYYKKVKCGKI